MDFYFSDDVLFVNDVSSYLDLSFGAGLAAHRAHHLAAVQPQLVVIDAQDALVPGAHVDVIVATLARIIHTLEVHDVIPGRTKAFRDLLSD